MTQPETVRLGQAAWVRARLGWKGLTADEYVDEGIPMLSTPDIKAKPMNFAGANRITPTRYDESPEIKLSVGDVLLTKDGSTIGVVAVVRTLPEPATVNGSIAVITPGPGIDGRFLHWVLASSSYQELMRRLQDGMGVPHLFQRDIKKIEIPRPALEAQCQIADYLDRETAQIDAFIAKNEDLLKLLEERRAAVLEETVGQNTSKAIQLKFLLDVPVTDGPHETPEFLSEGIPFLSVDAIQDGKLSFSGCRFISSEDHARYSQKARPQFGDVLMGKAASTGKIASVTTHQEFNVWSPLAILRPDPNLLSSDWLKFVLQSPSLQRKIDLACTVNTQKNIAMSDIGRLRIPDVPLAKQEGQVSRIKKAVTQLEEASSTAKRAIELAKERRAALISAAVTGKIDVRSAA